MTGGGPEQWPEVTVEYRELTKAIPKDMMVASEDLDLVKVMHALEAMDKKMDCGVGYQERKGFKEVVECGLVNKDPSLLQVSKIMEYLFEAEGGYLAGGLLPTTLFTCVYFHDRSLIAGHPFLHAYIEALAACITSVNQTIIMADVREDEEFTPVNFGVDCGEAKPPLMDGTPASESPTPITLDSAATRLREETAHFESRFPNIFPNADAAPTASPSDVNIDGVGEAGVRTMVALARMRVAWMEALACFNRRALAEAKEHLETTQKYLRDVVALRGETHKEEAAAATNGKADSKHVDPEDDGAKRNVRARPPPNEHVAGAVFNDAQYWVSMPNLFPCLPFPGYQATLKSWGQMLAEHGVVCGVEEKCTDLMGLVEFVETCFDTAPTAPQPHLLSRSRLMTLLYEKNMILGKTCMTDLIMRHLVDDLGLTLCDQVVNQPHLPTNLASTLLHTAAKGKKDKDAKDEPINTPENAELGYASHTEHFKRFVDRFSRCLLLYIYALCHNKARLRRKLSNLFVDWGHVQGTAWDVDRVVFDGHLLSDTTVPEEIVQRCAPLSTVVYDFVLRSMALFLTTGFELELYYPSEMQGVLWYVQYLTALRIDSLNHLQKTRAPTPDEQKAFQKKRSKTLAAGLPPVYAKRELRRPPIYRLQLLEATSFVQKGVLALCAACTGAGMLRDPGSKERRNRYCTEESRFEHRMLPFMQLMKPRFVRYKSYLAHNRFDKAPVEVLNDALGWLRFCKTQLLDQVKKSPAPGSPADQRLVDELSNVAKANMVSVILLQGAMTKAAKDGSTKDTVEFDWTYSKRLPLVKLVKAK